MVDDLLPTLGFKLDRNSTHTARTIMLSELTILLDWVTEPNASKPDYIQAIIHNNCLNKRSANNRTLTAKHLVNLYTLDPQIPIFRAMLYLWGRDLAARPLLALLLASARDSILHDCTTFFLGIPAGKTITRAETAQWISERYPERFSSVTLQSVAKNLNATWMQSGHLIGRAEKTRTSALPTAGAVSYALFLAYLEGFRGTQLFEAPYLKMLDCPEYIAMNLAQEASQRSWITFKRIRDVIEVDFPHFLTQAERELLRDQN